MESSEKNLFASFYILYFPCLGFDHLDFLASIVLMCGLSFTVQTKSVIKQKVVSSGAIIEALE